MAYVFVIYIMKYTEFIATFMKGFIQGKYIKINYSLEIKSTCNVYTVTRRHDTMNID